MKPIWLHIGLHKTGTSYLQSFFAHNVIELGKFGICYPNTGRYRYAHHVLSSIHNNEDTINELMLSIQTEAIPYSQILVSSEVFSNSFMDPARLSSFVKVARRHFLPRIIIYLRRQDDLKESVYSQVVKDWYSGSIDEENHYCYDHFQRIQMLLNEFSIEDIFIRAYDPKFWVDNKLENDFLSIFDIRNPDGFERVPPKNIRNNRRLTQLLSKIDKKRIEEKKIFRHVITLPWITEFNSTNYIWSPARRREFLLRYQESNHQLSLQANLPGRGEFLFAMPDDDEPWEAPSLPNTTEIAELVTLLCNLLAEEKRQRLVAEARAEGFRERERRLRENESKRGVLKTIEQRVLRPFGRRVMRMVQLSTSLGRR